MSKRRVDYDAEQELRFLFQTNRQEWDSKSPALAAVVAVMDRAHKGGASLNDLFLAAAVVVDAFRHHDQLLQNLPHIARGRTTLAALNRHNQARAVADKLRQQVCAADVELQVEFPKDAPRFREIAKRLNLTTNQVRHILKPSKRKPKR